MSMTAFARGEVDIPQGKLTMEMRSVNNRFLDMNLRLADPLRRHEANLRERVQQQIKRGRVELSVRLDANSAAGDELRVNTARIEQLAKLQRQVRKVLPKSKRLKVHEILGWPGVVDEAPRDDEALVTAVDGLLDTVIERFVDDRGREGQRLAETISQRVEACRNEVERLKTGIPAIKAHVRERLESRINEILDKVDNERIEQELILLLGKSDIDEEIDRLIIHLDEVQSILGQSGPIGRRLDFLMQELNREANTLGSKAAHMSVTSASTELKVLIEQMREQVQNIE